MSQPTNYTELPPAYRVTSRQNHVVQPLSQRVPSQTIVKSAKYPRVAVLLGIPKHWFIPLLLCRSLSIGFTIWWATVTGLNVLDLLDRRKACGARPKGLSIVGDGDGVENRFRFRLVIAQLILAYFWAFTAAYLSHLFTSSLMSRWLQHYSPLAVLVRLCSLSILFSYGTAQVFVQMGTMHVDGNMSLMDNLDLFSISLPLWICVSVALLVVYFLTQQDISIESDGDDRKRRLVLRFKCLAAVAGISLFSLVVLIVVVRLGAREVYFNKDLVLTKMTESKHAFTRIRNDRHNDL